MVSFVRKVVQKARTLWKGDALRPVRLHVARQYLKGEGIEIGALHNPLPTPKGLRVRYVDRMDVMNLRQQYPDLADKPLVTVDIVDDGETLASVPDGSQDFVIANHFVEHCENPIGAIRNFMRVLRPDGILYLALPDKRFTFDAPRSVTPLEHLQADDRGNTANSRKGHFLEYVQAVHNPESSQDAERMAGEYMAKGYSIHFHAWTQREMIELFHHLQATMPMEFELIQKNKYEVIFIVRKRDTKAVLAKAA